MLSINYNGFGVLTIKAIQEQQQMIDELEASVTALHQANESIGKRIATLEADTASKQQQLIKNQQIFFKQ